MGPGSDGVHELPTTCRTRQFRLRRKRKLRQAKSDSMLQSWHHKPFTNESRSVAVMHARSSIPIVRGVIAKAGFDLEVGDHAKFALLSLMYLNDTLKAWASREKFLQDELRAARSQVDKLLDQQAVLLAMLGRMGGGNGSMPSGHGGTMDEGQIARGALLQAKGQVGTQPMSLLPGAVGPLAGDYVGSGTGARVEPLTGKAAVNVRCKGRF